MVRLIFESPGRTERTRQDPVRGLGQRREFVLRIILEPGAGRLEDNEVANARADRFFRAAAGNTRKHSAFTAGGERVRMRRAIYNESFPAALGDLDFRFAHLFVTGKKMLAQDQAKPLDFLPEMLPGENDDRVFDRVRR